MSGHVTKVASWSPKPTVVSSILTLDAKFVSEANLVEAMV
jgi:hypothetical protein